MVAGRESRNVARDGHDGGRGGDAAVGSREGIDDDHGHREQRDEQHDAMMRIESTIVTATRAAIR